MLLEVHLIPTINAIQFVKQIIFKNKLFLNLKIEIILKIDSYENQYDYQINSCNPPSDSNSNLNCNSQLDNCMGQNYLFPYQTHPYYSYLPGPFYHDNYWYRDKKHKKEKRNDSIKNHNENNIFINSPTGPNSI